MTQTITKQRERTWQHYLRLSWLVLMFLLAGILGLQAQNINWNASVHPTYAEDLNEGSSEATDLYIYFEVEAAAISGGKVIVTLPYSNESFDLVKFPIEKLAGSADLGTPTFTNNVLTFTGVNLAQGAAVWYRIPRYLKTQFNGIRTSNKVKVDVYKTSSAVATNGTKNDIGYNYRYATLLVVDPTSLPANQVTGLQMNFGDNNGVKTATPTAQNYQFGIQCTGGQIDSLTMTMKFMYGGADLTNWKVAGQPIPANQISASYLNGSTVLDEITYTIKIRKSDIPGGKGLKDGTILPLTVDVVKNNCGGLNVSYSTVWAEQATIKTQYTSSNSGSFNSNPGDGKQPILKGFTPTWNDTGNLFCQNGNPETVTLAITNTGAGKARNIRLVCSSGGFCYIDTANLMVRTGKYGVSIHPKDITVISTHSGNSTRPIYQTLPTRVSVGLEKSLSPNGTDTLYIDYVVRCHSDLRIGDLIPGVNNQEAGVYIYANDLVYKYADDCASQIYTLNQGNNYFAETVYGYGITEFDSGISLTQNASKVYSHKLRVDPFEKNKVTSNNAKAVAKVKLPKGLAISGASDIQVYRDGYASSPWPIVNFQMDNVSDPDSTIYSFELVNSTRKGITDIKTTTLFTVDINITNTCNPAENISGKFKIWYAFYPTGNTIGGTCADVVYNSVQIYPTFSRQCVQEHVTYSFDFQRANMGLKDLNDDQKPDGTGKATASDGINLKQILVNDTVKLTWDAQVLENGDKYLYAVLLSEYNFDRYSIMDGGVPLTLTLNGVSGSLQALPKNTVRAGNILQSYDRTVSVLASERYAYIWEISKTDGTAFSINDKVLFVVQTKATEASYAYVSNANKRNVTSWLYATESSLADIPTVLSPGTARKGIEEYPVTYSYSAPFINVSSPAMYSFAGPQTVKFYENSTYFYIDYLAGSFSPKEYRHLSTVDSIVIEVPEGYILADALTFRVRTVNNMTVAENYSSPRTINASTEGNLLNRKKFVFGKDVFDVDGTDPSKLPLPDGYYGIYPQNYILTATSAAISGQAKVTAYADNHSYTQANVPNMGNYFTTTNPPSANQRLISLQYVDIGSLKVVSPSATVKPALASEITYDVTLQNTKTDGDAYSAWLYVQGPVENVKLKIGSTEYIGEQEGNRWIKLPVVAMNNPASGVLTVNYLGSSDCADQKVTLYTLFDRTKTAQDQWTPVDATIAMTDAGFIAAQKDISTLQYIGAPLKLTIQNVDSRISGSITDLSITPSNPASPSSGNYGLSTVKVGTAFPVEVVFNTQGAQGMVIKDSVELTIPGGLQYIANSAYFEVGGVNTVVSNADILSKLSTLNGTTGSKVIKLGMGTLPGNSLSYLRFQMEPTCDIDITKAEQIKAVFTGKQSCGPDAKGNGYQALSSFLMLTGTVPSYDAAVTIAGTLAQMSCKTGETTQTLTFTFKKTNLPASSVDGSDSIRIVLPKALDLSGTISYTYPTFGSVTGSAGTFTPKNYIDGESRILSWVQPKAYYDALAANLAAASVTCTYTINIVFVKSLATSPVPAGQILGGAMASTKAAASCPSVPGFIATAVKAVKVFATPIVDQPGNVVVCAGATVPQIDFTGNYTDAGYGYRWSFGGTAIGQAADAATSNIPSFTATNTGTTAKVATVTVTPTLGDCDGTAQTFTITVNPLPTFTPRDTTICSGSSLALSETVKNLSSNASIKFYESDKLTEVTTVSPTVQTTYYAKATSDSPASCPSDFQAIVVSVNPVPSMTAPSNQTYNPGVTTTAIALSGTDVTGFTWSGGANVGLSDGSHVSQIGAFTTTNAGTTALVRTITVTPQYTSGNTCSGTPVTFTITVNPPVVAGTFAATSACLGTPCAAIVPTGGTDVAYYKWTGGSGLGLADYSGTDKASIPSFTPSASGTATITATPYNSANIAGGATTFVLTVNSAPTVTVSHNQTPTGACLNTDVIFTTQTGTDYVWTVDGATITSGATATSNTATLQWATAGTKTVTVNYKNSNGCQAATSSQATISINTKPAVAPITLPAAVCEGTALTLPSPTVTAQGTPVTTQTWKLNNVAYTAGTLLTYADNGKSLTFTASSACGDSIVTVGNITVNAKPTVAPITLPAAICEGSALTLPTPTVAARGTAITAQTWKLAGTAYTAGTTLTYADNGKSLTFTASSACGDSIVTVGNIIVNAKPTVAPITLPAAICEGSALALPTPTVAARGTAITTQTWKLAGTAYTAGTVLTYADNGKSLTFTASSACGDSIITVGNITVNAKPTVAPITLPAAICEGSALTLPTPTVAARGTAITAQTWKLAGTAYTTGTLLTYADNGKSLTFTASSACGDSIVTVGNITVNAKPTVAPIILPAAICAGNALALPTPTVAARGTAITAQTWKLNGVAYTPGTNLAYSDNGKSLTFTASSACGDSVVTVGNITVYQTTAINTQPSVPAGIKLSNGYIIPGSIVPLSVAAVGHNLTYQWYWKKASDGSTVTLSDNSKYTGSTTASLTINNAYETENGDYYVTVTGTCNTVTSTPVTIVAVANQDASLKDLKVNGSTLSDFNPGKTDYLLAISCDDEQVTILGTPNFAGVTSITGNGTFALQPGDNYFPITIVAQDMVTTRTYTVNVVRNCYVPKIKKDLDDAVICLNGTHTWTIEAEGENLTYEWYKGETRIMGQNAPSITFTDAKFSDYDRYYVVVRSNHNGFKSSIQSKKVRLWVADYLPEHLRLAEYPNPATVGKNYHLKVDGYVDVTKYSWSYSKSGVTFSPAVTLYNDNETWATFGSLSVGTGTLKVTMEHPCGTRELTQTITVNYPTGVDDVTATVVTVYPNPTSGMLKVSGTVSNQMIRVTDVTGSLKGSYKTQEGITTIDLTGYAKGTYLVQYNGKAYKVIRK